jgi:23S rRNA pseudouridine2604 synthase
MKMTFPIRINKYLALNNYSTRKGADEMIKKGLVYINGKKALLGSQVEKKDIVLVKEDKNKEKLVYYAYNKKVGISTNKDAGSRSILDVTKFPTKVFPVGRLDKDSHGLILMTNDGRVTDKLLSPRFSHEKEYLVKVEPNFSDKFVELMSNGVHFDNYVSKKCKVIRKNKNSFYITLTEGKKRQIRRMCEALHHKVLDLKRIRIMDILLENTKEGEYRSVEGKELETLLKSLNLK